MAFLIKNMQYNDQDIVYINGNLIPVNKLIDTSHLTYKLKYSTVAAINLMYFY